MYLNESFKKITNNKIECQGCSEDEITLAEKSLDINFPSAYVEFLKICGKDSGDLFCGDVIQLANFNYINEVGKESFKEAFKRECPENFIFILEHHGYSFYYFDKNGAQNPDLFLFVHGDEILNEIVGEFSVLLNQEVDRFLKVNHNTR